MLHPRSLVLAFVWIPFSHYAHRVSYLFLGGIFKSAQICHHRLISQQSDINALLGRIRIDSEKAACKISISYNGNIENEKRAEICQQILFFVIHLIKSEMRLKIVRLCIFPNYIWTYLGLSKQCRSWSDAAERGVWSGSPLFATHPAVFRRMNRKSNIFVHMPMSATFFRGDWSWNIFYGHSLPSADSRRAVVSFWRKNVHNTG